MYFPNPRPFRKKLLIISFKPSPTFHSLTMKGNILCMTLNFTQNQNRQRFLFIEGITFSSIMSGSEKKINRWEKNAGWAVDNRTNALMRAEWPVMRTQCNKLQITLKSLLGKHFLRRTLSHCLTVHMWSSCNERGWDNTSWLCKWNDKYCAHDSSMVWHCTFVAVCFIYVAMLQKKSWLRQTYKERKMRLFHRCITFYYSLCLRLCFCPSYFLHLKKGHSGMGV